MDQAQPTPYRASFESPLRPPARSGLGIAGIAQAISGAPYGFDQSGTVAGFLANETNTYVNRRIKHEDVAKDIDEHVKVPLVTRPLAIRRALSSRISGDAPPIRRAARHRRILGGRCWLPVQSCFAGKWQRHSRQA